MDKESKQMAQKTKIAVTGPDSYFPWAWWCCWFILRWFGCKPIYLTSKTYMSHQKERFHGVIISGGTDIDPSLYGLKLDTNPKLDPERDAFESEIIKYALKSNLPLLGICRGAQLLNVLMGGDLYNDLSTIRNKASSKKHLRALKQVYLKRDSILYNLFNRKKIMVNSLHNQAIKNVGDGLISTARDEDEIIQGIESTSHLFIIGVQWHPEYMLHHRCQRRLFFSFVEVAKNYKPKILD